VSKNKLNIPYINETITKYLIGYVASSITPKGLNCLKEVVVVLPTFIANYRGARGDIGGGGR
jgi:hypothetical protein